MTAQQDIPKLRLPGFEGEWNSMFLGELLEFKNGINAPKEQYGKGIKFINVLDILNSDTITYEAIIGSVDIDEDTLDKYPVRYGDVLFQRSSETREEVGTASVYIDSENTATFGGFVIRGRKTGEYDPYFLVNALKSDSVRDNITSRSGGSTRFNVGQEVLSSISVALPSLLEQTKIASFLSKVEEKLMQLKKKKELLEQYKKGMMQKIFSQEVRFKDEKGEEFPDWEEKKLGDISTRVTRKNTKDNRNVLTISAQLGLVSQLEYFNKSVSSNNLTGYFLLEKGDFAYNKSYSKGYPMGAIKSLTKYEKGVVSTLYICFRFQDTINPVFMENYFESGVHNYELEQVAQEGARNHGLLNIGVNDFFYTQLEVPSYPEQTKIANFLSAIDKKINHTQTQIDKAEQWKKGLLQQMFV